MHSPGKVAPENCTVGRSPRPAFYCVFGQPFGRSPRLHFVTVYRAAVLLEFALALATFLPLLFIPAPYGRYSRRGWGSTIPARAGWVIMESPAVLFFATIYALGSRRGEAVPVVLLCLWQLHYLQRTLVFPFRISPSKRTPVLIVLMAISFNVLNGFINARWISEEGVYQPSWFADPRFLLGAALFGLGFVINITSDQILLRLRKPGDQGYHIPTGGLFNWVSCPNYLGEMVEWFGWALATWSWAGLAFALYTVANLAPRALSHHAWYRQHFPNYPQDRKALLPLLL